MPTKLTFSTTSSKHGWTVEHSLLMPSQISDSVLIEERYGSVERMIEQANAQWKVSAQRGMRDEETPTDAKAYADEFVDDGKKRTKVKTVVVDTQADDAPEFSEEQLEYIRRSGAVTR